MTWIDCLKAHVRHTFAAILRNTMQRRTTSALAQLDDRMLAIICFPCHGIADYARELAHSLVSVPPKPTPAEDRILERLRSWGRKRATTLELSALDNQLLRDIEIESDQIEGSDKAAISQRRDSATAGLAIPLLDAIPRIIVPVQHRPRVPARSTSRSRSATSSAGRTKASAEQFPDVRALQERTANDSQLPEQQRGAAAGV
jgi:uncharacterized protein YjiS (DUF1127 family)